MNRTQRATAAGACIAVVVLGALLLRRRRRDGAAWQDDQDSARLPTAHAFGHAFFDCGCADLYLCPASDGVECPRHSGFSVCCDRPSAHVAVREEDVVRTPPG